MAGVSTKEIKNRIRSMESTKQINVSLQFLSYNPLVVLASQTFFHPVVGGLFLCHLPT